MKIKNTAVNSLLYTLYMIGSCLLVMLVESLFIFIINKFAVIPFLALTVIRLVIYSLGVPTLLAVIGYFEGYREGDPAIGETIGGGALAVLIHFLFAFLFHFQAFVSGGVRFAAGLIKYGTSVKPELLNPDTSVLVDILMFLVYGAVYVGVLTIARYFGAQNRVIDRSEMRRDEAS